MDQRLLQFYNNQIHFLIQEKNIVYGLCVDLTTDEVIARVDRYLKLSFLENQKDINDWLKRKIYKYISYPDEVIEIEKVINRTNLLDKYVKGHKNFSLRHYFLWNNEVYHCCLNVHLFDNPINQHIQGYLFWQNDTKNYIDSKITDILYKNDYKALALIDVRHQNAYIRLNNFDLTNEYEKQYLDYKRIIEYISIHQVAPNYQEQFLKLSSLSNLKENMSYLGHYSFKVFNENFISNFRLSA